MVAGRALLLRWTPAAKAPHHLRAPPVPCLSTALSSSREAGGGRRGTSSCSAICCSCPIPSMCTCSCHDHKITLPLTLPIRRQDTFFLFANVLILPSFNRCLWRSCFVQCPPTPCRGYNWKCDRQCLPCLGLTDK